MKAITLHQPWASLVAAGVKTVETRSWRTSYRGPLAIHAGLKPPAMLDRVGAWTVFTGSSPFTGGPPYHVAVSGYHRIPLPLGAIVATCELKDCVRSADLGWTEIWDGWAWQTASGSPARHLAPGHGCRAVVNVAERPYGDYSPGQWAWLLGDICSLEPIPAKGHRQVWEWAR